ncbi:unnamed protein product [Urochloa humidicola]
MKFDPPTCDLGSGYLDFMLFPGAGENSHNHKVLVTDNLTGRALLYDPESPTVRSLPDLTAPKRSPVSIIAGGGDNDRVCYVLDTNLTNHPLRTFSLDAFVRDAAAGDDWRCLSLPPPPFAAAGDPFVHSYAAVGGTIWASCTSGDGGLDATYCFDTAGQAWAKAGDWALPFSGLAHHVSAWRRRGIRMRRCGGTPRGGSG